MAQDMVEHAFELGVSNGWIPKVWLVQGDCTLLSQEFKHAFHSMPLRSHVQCVIGWGPLTWMNKEE